MVLQRMSNIRRVNQQVWAPVVKPRKSVNREKDNRGSTIYNYPYLILRGY